MGHIIRFLFLSWLVVAAGVSAEEPAIRIAPGEVVPDFSLPAANGWGQRLAEVKGQAVMLLWLDDCDQCDEGLVQYQLLAEGLKSEGLVTWFIWTPDDDDRPPRMRLPVLVADPHWRTGWGFEPRPAIMLIKPDGVLEHLLLGDLNDDFEATEALLTRWLAQQQKLNITDSAREG